ncbi:unnamed protein product [Paramecium sonneborni]|uniref:Uncharacterized protein n=1 Tax=Paramecium sonneborni TaxID=65129 RepID=A0A8S1NDG7_9CILI|nr:unnamed protein product [Paramecium sonneborni]
MIIHFSQLLSFLLLVRQVKCQCEFLPFENELNIQNPQGEYVQELPIQVIQGEQNVGFGIWMNYRPLLIMEELDERNSKIVISKTEKIIINEGDFIYLIEQRINKYKIIVVSVSIDSTTQSIYYQIFYSFKQNIDTLIFAVDILKYEGIWIMFYVYFDQNKKQTTFGIYNPLEVIPTQTVNDLPYFELNILHKFGGLINYQNQNREWVILNRFHGIIDYTFTTNEENIFSDFESCPNPSLSYDICYDEERIIFNLQGYNQALSGEKFYERRIEQAVKTTIYVLNGWLKLNHLSHFQLETVIFRITSSDNYNDDLYFGDQQALLKYYQNNNPINNGLEISTYSYQFPLKRKQKTDNNQKVSQFGEEFQELLINWHYFDYQVGTLNNNGQPILQIYFPTINEIRQYKWSEPIQHFKQTNYYILFGGDHYSKTFMSGYASGINIEFFCEPQEILFSLQCHYSCLTCDGPTSQNCLSCSEISFRQFQETQRTCQCQKGFLDLDDQMECKSALQELFHISKQEIELKCSKPGQSDCHDQNIQCDFGYFEYNNNCIQCPFQKEALQGTKIFCLNCITEPKDFAKTLLCSQDAETYFTNIDYVFKIKDKFSHQSSPFEIQLDENQNYIVKLSLSLKIQEGCKEGYFLKENKCYPCSEMCLRCQSSSECYCCIDGFFADSNKQCRECKNCKTCSSLEFCLSCNEGQQWHYYNCITCGHNCKSCDYNGYCLQCNESPSLYYVSLDGKNCRECNIENCIYCFEYIYNGGLYYTNLDLKFNIINYDIFSVFFSCALCKENYFFNSNSQKCELKPLNDDCDFAIIFTDSTQKCIISSKNIDAVQNIDCLTLQYCKQCIKNYNQNDSFCILCEDGYYSSLLTGQCKQCAIICKTCIEQNKQQQDFWKWDIKATHQLFQNLNNNRLIENYETIMNLEQICTSCQIGYVLYKHQCIKDCDKTCEKCEIINEQSTCVQCHETQSGFLKSINSKGICQQCPFNCVACLDRTKEEIYEINPYFIMTNLNEQFTRKCFEKTRKINEYENYFYDSYTQQINTCNLYNQCYNKILIKQNLYCDDGQYNTLKYDAILKGDKLFEYKNIWIRNLFEEGLYFTKLETPSLYKYLNEISIREVEYQFTLIQNEITECFFTQFNQINQKIQQNVFTLQQVNILFIGEAQPTVLRVFSNLTFSNFTTISFHKIQFRFSRFSYDSIKLDYFPVSLFSIKKSISLRIINCTFTNYDDTETNYSLTIKSNIPYTLYIEDLIISKFYIYNSDIFVLTAQESLTKNSIQLKNVLIIDSYFYNSSFLKFQAQNNDLSQNLELYQIQILNTQFIQSNFLISNCQLNFSVGSLSINSITVQNIRLEENSSLIYLPCINQSQIFNLILDNSMIFLGSKFYSSNIIHLQDWIINNTKVANSTLISNNVDYSKSNQAILSSSSPIVKNCSIINVQYDNDQQILVIIKYKVIKSQKFELRGLILQNCFKTSRDQEKQTSYEQSMIFIECQICYLEDIQILRRHGLPELTIMNSEQLEIRNLTISQNQYFLPKSLHSNIECVKQYTFFDMYFYLYIGQYQNVLIDQLKISNSLSFNNPFIVFSGYDIMLKIHSEKITIQNVIITSNMLIIFDANQHASLISIISQQQSSVMLSNINFTNNHLNEYYEDLTRASATTMYIQLQFGTVIIDNCIFFQNIVTNSSDAILYVKAFSLLLRNSLFQNSGLINVSHLSQHLIFSEFQDLSENNYNVIFPIKSSGGNGFFIISILEINNITINTSHSYNGGGFQIKTHGTSLIHINNSLFYNTMTSLEHSIYSMGGCFHIDASLSKFTFKLHNSIIDSSYSRYDGGAIYIIPSLSYNWIEYHNLIVTDCFSLQNSFFSYVLSKIETIFSSIIFQNIQFYSTEYGFQQYFSQISDLSEDDASNIAKSNPMIFVQYGNITILNCSFLSTYIQFFLKIEQAENVVLQNVKVINCTVLQSPLFKFNLRSQLSGQLQISNLQLSNIIQIKKEIQDSCILKNYTIKSGLQCPAQLPQVPFYYDEEDQTQQRKLQLDCNQFLIYTNSKMNYSLIEIDKFNKNHKLIVEKMLLSNIYCETCEYGLFRILQIENKEQENFKFSQVIIKNCICGITGCLSILKRSDESIFKNSLLESARLLQQQNYDQLHFKQNLQISILDSTFLNNTALYGGSLFIFEVGILIKNCIFQNNSAQIGGAIYFYSQEAQVLILNSQIIQNAAKIAGGVFLNQQSLQLTKELDFQLSNNNSTMYGNDIFEKPRSLTLSVDGGKTVFGKTLYDSSNDEIIEQIINNPYKAFGYSQTMRYLTMPTGRSIGSYQYFDYHTSIMIPYNLTFRIIALDKFLNQIKGLSNTFCTINSKTFNTTSQKEEPNFNYNLSIQNVTFNEITGDYNLDDLIIYFKPNLTNDLVLQLTIQCNSISVPQYENEPPFKINNTITNYKLLVNIKTFPCQLGEFLNSTSGGCTLCDTFQNQYQVQWNAQSCSYKDDLKMKSIQSSMIELRSGYWRAYYYSQIIEYCYHLLENCQGGWKPGDYSCTQGHIGALCEQCDLYDTIGLGSYSVSSKYSCGNCNQIAFNIISIILITLWTLISTLMSVSSTVEMIDEFIIGLKLKVFGGGSTLQKTSSAILIKIFTNYLQIISTIFTFQLQVPIELTSFINSVGNPIESMAYSLDCFLVSRSDILIIYFRIIWSQIMATLYITIFFTLGGIAIITKLIKFEFSYISTTLIYLFIYLQPNIIGGLISLLSFRKISGELWIQGNVAYRYDTISHAQWMISFCLPLIIIFGFILPFFLWYGVHKNRHSLDKTQVRQTWGYLYNEYKLNTYYWETIKIFQKQIIIIVLTYYDDYIPIKASIVFLMEFGYSYLATSYKPYQTGQLNQLDAQSTVVCAVSIILASSIYAAQQQQIQEIFWPFYVIIGLLNSLFILTMILQILFTNFKKLDEKLDTIKEIIAKRFPYFVNSHPFIKKLFKNRKSKKSRIQERFNKIKLYLKPQVRKILEFKKMNNFQLPGTTNTQKSEETEREDDSQYRALDSLSKQKQREARTFQIIQSSSYAANDKTQFFLFPKTRINQEVK